MSSSDEGGSTSNCSTPDSQKKYRGVRHWKSGFPEPKTGCGSAPTRLPRRPRWHTTSPPTASKARPSWRSLTSRRRCQRGCGRGCRRRPCRRMPSDAGMFIDARFAMKQPSAEATDGCGTGKASGEKVFGGFENERWRNDQQGSFGNWDGSEQVREGERLNISVEDYL
ncbi:hypothetical protein Vadar_000583 [Vaccinium darrowii]|uniref:Uncharacterized protein n=1 Tax=Vaccinium darrowii TaxID=229202 RepID=A0ACB7WWQ3_9ERIC|nr:hypothetical protein Vadar_000583 [Vaccinium darrowii]